jgi:hypothetical protein
MNKIAMDINKVQVLTGMIALVLGFMVYLLRSPGSVCFVPAWFPTLSPRSGIPSYIVIVANGLPDFIHPFAFALLTSGLISSSSRGIQFLICLGWFILESFFEFGQYYKDGYLRFIPSWLDSIPFLQNAKNFFLNGTFDPWDILFILGGTVTAFCVMSITSKRRRER